MAEWASGVLDGHLSRQVSFLAVVVAFAFLTIKRV